MYTKKEAVGAYRSILPRGATVYIGSDIRFFGQCADAKGVEILSLHIDAILEAIGPDGTAVFPAATLYLANTDDVFCPLTSCSRNMGVLSEFARQNYDGHRSLHPLWSHYSIGGENARPLVKGCSNNAHDNNSVWARLRECDAIWLSVGHHPRENLAIVHHLEFMAGVSYRYSKDFHQRLVVNGKSYTDTFQLFVLKNAEAKFKRDRNKLIFEKFEAENTLRSLKLGHGRLTAFQIPAFCNHTLHEFDKNPDIWFGKNGRPDEL